MTFFKVWTYISAIGGGLALGYAPPFQGKLVSRPVNMAIAAGTLTFANYLGWRAYEAQAKVQLLKG